MGLTPELLRELDLPQFEDAETARRYLESQSWPEGPVCAHCGEQERVTELKGYSTRPGCYVCRKCRGQFTVTVKTVFHRTHVPLHKWLQVTAAVEKMHCCIEEIGAAIDVSYRTAWRMRRIIRPDIKYGGRATGRRQALCYPFLPETSKPLPEHELLRLINEAVPRGIPEDRRADICQELAIAVLIGEVETPDLATSWQPMFHKVYAQHPTLYAPLSLDAPIPGTEDLRLIDTLSTEDSIWNKV
jgi:transposase-like protein